MAASSLWLKALVGPTCVTLVSSHLHSVQKMLSQNAIENLIDQQHLHERTWWWAFIVNWLDLVSPNGRFPGGGTDEGWSSLDLVAASGGWRKWVGTNMCQSLLSDCRYNTVSLSRFLPACLWHCDGHTVSLMDAIRHLKQFQCIFV